MFGTFSRMLSACVTVAVGLVIAGPVARHEHLSAAQAGTQVVLLGTGNPPADPDRSGPATAVVAVSYTHLTLPTTSRV